ncbi:hypothetical protein HMPREF1508_2016 [Shuttleworthella sp. MSX8B]|nr:hypothetical protein HMPREF1508_2016 [Shuttleworthia sp. MSX8B]
MNFYSGALQACLSYTCLCPLYKFSLHILAFSPNFSIRISSCHFMNSSFYAQNMYFYS